jgi:RNA polymerase sigma-70 factor (ECF subfamily)
MEDGALVNMVRAGDRGAFTTLVERHQARVIGLCYRVAGNMPDAEDLAHQAFVEAYVKLGQLREPERFGGWLRTIALNLCRAWYRQRRNGPAELRDDVAAVGEPEDALGDRMQTGLAQLSAAHRLIVVLHHGEGLSYEQVARFLDVPVGTVMSRLHRARTQLKRITEEMLEQDTPTHTPDFDFKKEIEVEIEALLRMFPEDARARERLSIILDNAPERFAALIRQADEAEARADLALLLRRAGPRGIEVTLDCCLSTDEALRANASAVLGRFIATAKTGVDTPYATRIAARGAYLIVDAVARSSDANTEMKARLLADLLPDAPDERTLLLFLNALMCYDGVAMAVLVERAGEAASPEALHAQPGTVHGLCRMGSRFAGVLLEWLSTGDAREKGLALAGAEAVARSLTDGALDWKTAGDERVLLEQRFRLKWAPPVGKLRDPRVWSDLAEAVAREAAVDRAEHRDAALRALGLLVNLSADPRWVELIHASAGHPVLSTRLAALRAIGDYGDTEAGDILLRATHGDDPAERRAAVELVGRLKVEGGVERATELLGDGDAGVRRSAISALGEYESPAARLVLEDVLRGPDKTLAKAAAGVLFGKRSPERRFGPGAEGDEPPVPKGGPPGRARTIGDLVRDGATPPYYIALDAAIRAVPEIRPYHEGEFSRIVARACYDFACTRRFLVEEGLTRREGNVYTFTEIGEAVWRVERYLKDKMAEIADAG